MSRRAASWRRPEIITPLGLFALALLLRLIGVDWHGTHPDEDIGGPARMLAGDLRLHSFYYPPLLTYLVAAAYVPLFAVGRLLGWWHSAGDLRAAYFAQPTAFFVTARIVVALCSASAAPIAWALARQIGAARRAAALVGLAAALLPGAIYWAHIAKSDNGLGPAFLLVALLALRLLERPGSISRALLTGGGIALAISFKQSAIFFLAPLLLVFVLASLRQPAARVATIKAWAIAFAAMLVVAAILNLGVLLDPQPFIAGQAVQSQMSFRPASLAVTAATLFQVLTSADTGLPAVALVALAAIFIPALTQRVSSPARLLFAALALGWLVGTIVVCKIAGSRQPSHLWLPYLIVLVTLGALAAATLLDRPERPLRAAGAILFALLFVAELVRIEPILAQATAPSMGARVAALVRQFAPVPTRIASGLDLPGLPISPESQTLPRARNERLAARYGMILPPPDRPLTGTPGGYTVIGYPFVIGGLETYRPDEVKVVLAYAWPIQPEEWQLDRWLADGFHLFVVTNPVGMMASTVPEYRAFFRAIDRCPRLADLPAARPLFLEEDVRLYRCG